MSTLKAESRDITVARWVTEF